MTQKKVFLPKSVAKYFWGDDQNQLSWIKHQGYIIKTILEKGDTDSIKWLMSHTQKQILRKNLSKYQLSPKSTNFWSVYLS